ncbi:ADP-ribosylglycohydrolase family protein [Micromonospora sp. B11E3]|uniref:ADP-ribosylglycohydrolase family protein n=1 Tax=Micromonospora sp. B11E3 TaxID=3153562 RepID=UPI00325EE666
MTDRATLDTVTTADRARGCLAGVALGDAMGMPGELWPRQRVVSTFGSTNSGWSTGSTPKSSPTRCSTTVTDPPSGVVLGDPYVAGHSSHSWFGKGHRPPWTLKVTWGYRSRVTVRDAPVR